MELKTKFSLGDKLWALKNNKAFEFEVGRIAVHVSKDTDYINYFPTADNNIGYDYLGNGHEESVCFASKQELIDSL